MHPQAKSQIVEQLVAIAAGAVNEASSDKRHVGGNVGHGPFYLEGTHLESFEDLLSRLLRKEGYQETLSERFATQQLLHAIGELRPQPETGRAEEILDSLLDQFANAVREQAVYVPLDGINVAVQEIEFGRVVLSTMDQGKLDDVLGYSKEMFAGPANDVLGRTVARFECTAESERAVERAKEEVSRVLDIFRFAIPFMQAFNYSSDVLTFGIQGTVPSYLTCTVLRRETQKPGADFGTEITGPVPFTLDNNTIARINEIGGSRLSDALRQAPQEQTDFVRVLLRGVHWFANAQIQKERENELLNLVTCLETFLTPRDGNPIGTAIAEGIAILLETGLEERKHMKKTVQRLYRLRSGVSHGGEKSVSDSDLEELRDIAKRLVTTMIGLADTMESQKALLQHIEDQKLG